jgi:hypothetical protein
MWWLVASALADDRVLYATDYTSGVDGASRAAVAQVVQGRSDGIASCVPEDWVDPVELSFGWEGGRPVGVESSGTQEMRACIQAAVEGWRGRPAAAGPYAWEIRVPGTAPAMAPEPPPRAVPPPATAALPGSAVLIVVSWDLEDKNAGRALRAALPTFARCIDGDREGAVRVRWVARDGALHSGTVLDATGLDRDEAWCLASAGRAVTYDGFASSVTAFFIARDPARRKHEPELIAPSR